MKKTAMMELIEELYAMYRTDNTGTIRNCIIAATSYLPTERQNIEEAYKVGHEDGVDDDEPYQSDYFTQTYEQK